MANNFFGAREIVKEEGKDIKPNIVGRKVTVVLNFTSIMNISILQMFSIISCMTLSSHAEEQDHYYSQKEQEYQKKPIIPIIRHTFEQDDDGFKLSYETGNGIHVQQNGYIKNKGDKKHEVLIQQGTVTYHDEHGKPITLTYTADEHGFHPQGSHLPTPPPSEDHGGQEEEGSYDQSAENEQEQQNNPEIQNYHTQNQYYDYVKRERRY